MPTRLARRSGAQWVTRIVLAMIVAAVGFFVVAGTIGYGMRSRDPVRAHAWAPLDGRVTALLARGLSGPEATSSDPARAVRLARLALRQDPTAVTAAVTLGANLQLQGGIAAGQRLLAFSQALSRRDMSTQLWAVEEAVARSNIPGALRHYDIALRTQRQAPDLLFPVLVSALQEPAVRVGLVRTLAARPPWGTAFVDHLIGNGRDAIATVQFLIGLRRSGVPVAEGASAAIIDTLVAEGHVDAAWSYYVLLRPGVTRQVSRDPRFSQDISSPSPFDWMPINEGGTVAVIQRAAVGGSVDFSAPTSVGGPLLRQLQLLPPGGYRLQGHGIAVEQPDGSSPYWQLTCRADGRDLGRVAVSNSALNGGRFQGRFSVPRDCSMQVLALVARPSEAAFGLSGQIDRVQLRPVKP